MKVNFGTDLVEVDGCLVERDALRVAEAINAYDENLKLLCLDPSRAEGVSDAPFVVVAKYCDRDEYYPVLRAWKLDDELLVRLQAADMQRTDVLGSIMSSEENYRKNNQKRYEETRELMKEQTAAVVGTRQSRYVLRDDNTGEYITFWDDRPAERGKPGGSKYFT